jgi:hypothetical protein
MFRSMLRSRKVFAIGGLAASLILIGFGAASMVIGYNGRNEVRDTLRQEQITGPADSTIPGQLVDTGAKAQAEAEIMRHHQLTSSQGLTYSQMGKYKTPDGNPKGTNDAKLAALDTNGNPISNPIRDSWVTETALTTALNTANFAEQVGDFAMVMGAALFLTGVGFGVLIWGAMLRPLTVVAKATETTQAAIDVTKPATA